jgi:glutathione S-transferase
MLPFPTRSRYACAGEPYCGKLNDMLTIWGRMNSSNVQKVVWAAEECGIAYERHDAGMAFGIVNTPEYRAMNPNGLVPCIRDGELVLWESNAIVRYLAAAYAPGRLWPVDPRERALADRWMDWQASTFQPAYNDAFRGLIRTAPDKRDHAVIDASRVRTEGVVAILDAHLAGREWLGESFGIAELALGPFIDRWLRLPLAREPRPNAEAWHKRITARPTAACFAQLPVT